jgi:hypothetical protein
LRQRCFSDVPTLAPNFDPVVVSCYFGDYDQQVQWNGAAYLQWSDARNLQNAHPDPDVWFERQPTNGVLNGTVTDAASLAPIAGARVEAVGFGTYSTYSAANGAYTMTLPEGSIL